ncbi:MAG: phosphoribosylformylglycinamidine cyclo-ligase [Armatimonadota bacterium]|nr:phosphoribosylformylglycinamidine cyclo-ligase [Armatimonadota bacterium]MDR7561987.1 phosphoribosylformylglycinamidine cyclo-ligase [Armatimonadota bacterium]MDR7602574.1 phosphoribosylformylglycinamidine cyclo-ligase [Armatimonadota bacterium]
MKPLTYRDAGVDPEAKEALLLRLSERIRSTFTPAVLDRVGLFGGFVRLPAGEDLILVATVDGVGTKTEVANLVGDYRVVGHDVVAHNLNDLACHGARPLLFLDYFASGRWRPEVLEEVLTGVVEACSTYGVALLGGETAQMPDVYREEAFEVVGCAVGVVARTGIVDGSRIRPGDVLVGLASTGLHTNGYSLARRVLLRRPRDVHRYEPELGGTRGEALLRPHRCYAPNLLRLLEAFPGQVTGIAHITGGGIAGNLVRLLPQGCTARVRFCWPVPPIFRLIAREGLVEEEEMFRVFNMGIGMVVCVRPHHAAEISAFLRACGEEVWGIGEVVAGERQVEIVPEPEG